MSEKTAATPEHEELRGAPNGPLILISLTLTVSWLLLNRSYDPGTLVVGLIFGFGLSWSTRYFWPMQTKLSSPGTALLLFGRLMWDIVVSSIDVAKLVLGPEEDWHPSFIELPLDIKDDLAISILSNMISLTPGTVSVEVSEDRSVLRVHGICIPDPEDTIHTIKNRYEALLKEIFQC
jgi:multicomponent K+:H+ antiporter subunit E